MVTMLISENWNVSHIFPKRILNISVTSILTQLSKMAEWKKKYIDYLLLSP